MKCSKCSKRNIRNANYCKFCGHKFTNEEKEKSKNSGLLGLLNRFQKWYNLCTLSVITDHIAFKIIVVLGVLAIGIYNVISIGSELKVLDSSYYEVQYNKKNDEYYVVLDKDSRNNDLEVALNLFVPNHIEKLDLTYFSEDGNTIKKESYNKGDKVRITGNISLDNYYIISNEDNQNENIRLYVYYERGKVENEQK